MSTKHVMILAGEASGDAHAAEFVEVLRERQPELRISGMGSNEMKRAGVDVFFDSSIIAVMGLIEVLRHWGDIKRAMGIVRAQLDATRPDLLVLVDYPEFNLKMARHAKWHIANAFRTEIEHGENWLHLRKQASRRAHQYEFDLVP